MTTYTLTTITKVLGCGKETVLAVSDGVGETVITANRVLRYFSEDDVLILKMKISEHRHKMAEKRRAASKHKSRVDPSWISTAEIARQLGISPPTVLRRARELRISPAVVLERKDGKAFWKPEVVKALREYDGYVLSLSLGGEKEDGVATKKYTTKQAAAILDVPWDIMFRWAQEAGVDQARYGTRKFYTEDEIAIIKGYLENRPMIESTQSVVEHTTPSAVYEEQEWPVPVCIEEVVHKAVYLKRADTVPPSEGIGYQVDRRQMRPCSVG